MAADIDVPTVFPVPFIFWARQMHNNSSRYFVHEIETYGPCSIVYSATIDKILFQTVHDLNTGAVDEGLS